MPSFSKCYIAGTVSALCLVKTHTFIYTFVRSCAVCHSFLKEALKSYILALHMTLCFRNTTFLDLSAWDSTWILIFIPFSEKKMIGCRGGLLLSSALTQR